MKYILTHIVEIVKQFLGRIVTEKEQKRNIYELNDDLLLVNDYSLHAGIRYGHMIHPQKSVDGYARLYKGNV
jgi:hypothetical protein